MAAHSPNKSIANLPALLPMGHHTGKPLIPLIRPVMIIGSRSNARIHLVSTTVSKAHVLLVQSDGGVYIRDLASRGHVYVNGQQIRETDLNEGDLIKVGSFTFSFKGPSPRKSVNDAPHASLDVTGGQMPIPFDERVIVIGRRNTCDVHLLEESCSTAHAVIFEMDGERYVRDLGSRTGTFVNGVNTHQHKLTPGDVVRIGDTDIRYQTRATTAREAAGASATGYSLEAHDEIQPAPVDTHAEMETMGGPDLVGEIVQEEISARRTELAPVDDLSAIDLEPLEPEPQRPAPARRTPIVAPSAKKADLADELSVPANKAEESSSPSAAEAEFDASDALAEAADTAPRDLDIDAALELGTAEDQELHPRRGWRAAVPDEPVEPLALAEERDEPPPQPPAPFEQPVDDMRFAEPASKGDSFTADARGGAAVLDHDALGRRDEQLENLDFPEPAPPPRTQRIEGIRDEPLGPVRLDFSERAHEALEHPVEEPVSAPELHLDLTEEPLPQAPEVKLEPLRDEAPDFSVNEAAIKPLVELDKLPPPPPLKLSTDAEALAAATEALTRRRRARRTRENDLDEAAIEAPVEPFAFEQPRVELPPVEVPKVPEPLAPPLELEVPEPVEDRVEVLDSTEPTPESALDLDAATQDLSISDLAGADTAVTEDADQQLSDTGFSRAVDEFTAESSGELVEESGSEQQELSVEDLSAAIPPAPIEPPQQIDPEPPLSPARPRRTIDPFVLSGANRENFLGGSPLPRMTPPSQPRPQPPPPRRDAVEELIAEIDTAAAEAERARAEAHISPPDATAADRDISAEIAAAPFTTPGRSPSPSVGAAGFDQSIPQLKPGDKDGQVTAGFEGLAMPPARQADVFAKMSPPGGAPPRRDAEFKDNGAPSQASDPPRRRTQAVGGASAFQVPHDAPLEGGSVAAKSPEGLSLVAPSATLVAEPLTEASRGSRPTIPDIPPAMRPLPERRPAVVFDGEDVEINPGQIRRKYVRRVPLLITAMLALIALTAAGVYMLIPVRNLMEAQLVYQNLDKRTKRDRDEIQEAQLSRLRNDYLREVARRRVLQTPEVSPGFLDDPVQYSRVIDRAHWPDEGNVLKIRYEGTSRDADIVRLKALTTALYEDNRETLLKDARNSKNRVRELQDSIESNQKRLADLRTQISEQRMIYERRPSNEQVKQLEGELSKKEEAWKRAVAGVKEAEAVMAGLKQRGKAVQPAVSDKPDEELAKMERELVQLQTQMQALRDESSEKARQAREKLDAAMSGFQKEITDAAGVSGSNREFAAYVASAQQVQETTRDVIEGMVRRQEQQFESLMELKARLNEKMESRRSEMWQADQELQELTEKLAILTRQYNAAVGGGYKEEAEEKNAEVKLTESMIKARQELIPADPGYADSIQKLDQFIAATKKNIEEDRKRTDGLLARLQESFTSGPQMEKLPAEQKELAKRLKDRLEAINEARRQYTQSLDQGASATDKPEIQEQIATLQAGIDARKRQSEPQSAPQPGENQQAVQQQQIQIDLLKQEERKSEEAYFATRKELENSRTLIADARSSSEKLEKLGAENSRLEAELKTQNDTLVERQRDLTTAIEPLQPGDNDISVREGVDRRPTVLIFASLAILTVFSVLIGMTWKRALSDVPVSVPLAAEDLAPIDHPHPQPGNPNGNGTTHNDEDHQPAVV